MQELLDSVTTPTVKKYDAHDAKSKKHKKRRNVVSGRSDESASDEEQKSVETSRSTQRTALDPVAEEMRSWVTGYRDPEVLRRKESTPQRNRQHPKRFGVNSLEEQRYIDQVAKFYAEGSDAESDTDSPMSEGSDFSPADDVEEQDDGPLSDLELLSADDLNNDGSKKSRKKPRRRLRKEYRDSNCEKAAASQRKSPKKSKSPSNTISTQTELKQPTSSGSSKAAVSEQHRSSARKVNGFGGSSTVNQPIDLRSSGDEQSGSEHSSVEKSSRKITSTSSNSKDRRNEKPTVSALARDLAYVQSREPMPTSENKKTKGNTVVRRADPKKSTQHVTTSQPIVSSSPTKEKNNEALGANDVSRKSASKVSTRSQVVVSSRPGSMTSPTPETSNAENKERVVAENGVNDVSKKSASKANGQADEVSATEIKAAKKKDEEPAHVESSEQTAVPGLSKALLARHQEMIRNITSCQMSDEEFSETETVDLEAEDSEEIDVNLDARGVEDEEMHGNSKSATQEAERETAVPSGGDSDSAKLPNPNHKVQTQQASDPTNKPVGSQEEGKVSDAETMICDDSKAQNGIEEFEFGSSSRLDDLGFSDNSDDDTSNESAGAVAPHDDEYEQFFADASEKKKRKAKQKQEFKVAEQKPSESAKASDRTPDVEFIKFVPTPTSKENEKTKSATAAAKKESLGSNGLRKTTVISRSTMMKGKFAHSRRSIQLLDEDESLKSNGMRYDLAKNVQQNGTRKSNGTTKKRYSEPLVSVEQEVRTTTEFAFKAVSSSSGSARKSYGPNVFSKQDNNVTKKDDAAVDKRDERYSSNGSKSSDTRERADDKLEARYLSYTAKSKSKETTSRKYDSDDEPLSASVVKTSSKSRFGGSDIETPKVSFTSDVEKTPSWSFSPMVKSSNENIDANAANKMVYPRERQLDIYDALHIEGREENGLSARDLRD
uniref:Uncharacterized protein n=1 Tax=Globisporangium ultimum (strain ATCC 200006 / CBS 805.95 / DAOM BR144) TaxID=431595 RepID=K3WW69_GLOUD